MHYGGSRECVLHVSYMRVICVNAGMVEIPSAVIKLLFFESFVVFLVHLRYLHGKPCAFERLA